MPGPGRVFLVDDDPVHVLILDGILRVVGYKTETFGHPELLLARLSPADRGCVVMDLQLPSLSGLALQRVLRERGVHLPVVFVSGTGDIPDAVAAMKQGALDFLKKPVSPEALRAMVAQAVERDAAAAALRATKAQALATWAMLSQRERDVCRLFAKGLLTKQIASALSIHESTAQIHRVRGMQKLGLETIAELIDLLRLLDEHGDPSQ